jgi:hypothetical protein
MSEWFAKGMLIPIDFGFAPVIFQWNPVALPGPLVNPEYASIGTYGREYPYREYVGGKDSGFRLELLFTSDDGTGASVIAAWKQLEDLTRPRPSGMGGNRPPRVMVILPGWLREICVVTEVSPQFVIGRGGKYRETLAPSEATISVTFGRWRG